MESSLELSKKAKRKSQEGLSKDYYENNEETEAQKNGALPVGIITSIEEAREGKDNKEYPESEGSVEKEKEHFKDKNSIPISHSSSRKPFRLYPVLVAL